MENVVHAPQVVDTYTVSFTMVPDGWVHAREMDVVVAEVSPRFVTGPGRALVVTTTVALAD